MAGHWKDFQNTGNSVLIELKINDSQIYVHKKLVELSDTRKYFNRVKQSNAILLAKCRISGYLKEQKYV